MSVTGPIFTKLGLLDNFFAKNSCTDVPGLAAGKEVADTTSLTAGRHLDIRLFFRKYS